MTPALNFAGGLIIGLIIGAGICVLLVLLIGAFSSAMGARGDMHRANAFPVAIRVLKAQYGRIDSVDRHYVDMAIGLMQTQLERNSKG